MDYNGTDSNDIINQAQLGIANGAAIYGKKGDDQITISNANAIGGEGNDTITSLTTYAAAAYWTSTSGIVANLVTGKVQDGLGGIDTLVNVRTIQATPFDDRIIGSDADETFWGHAGSNTINGGGGMDTVILWEMKSTECDITYDFKTDTFTIKKNKAGSLGTETYTSIEKIVFMGTGSDEKTLLKESFLPGFLKTSVTYAIPLTAAHFGLQQIAEGDFNGDGKKDLLLPNIDFASIGAVASPVQIMLGDGTGRFVDGTSQVFQGAIPGINYVPRIFVADFNRDGIDDIFALDFGYDAPPFPGGQNSLFTSLNGKLLDSSSTLPQRLSQGHGASIGDVNNDGFPDLLVNNLNDRTGHAVDLYINDGTGKLVLSTGRIPASLNPLPYAPGHTWSQMLDVNGDGSIDIILGSWDANASPSVVMLNDGKGNFTNAATFALPDSGVTKQVALQIKSIDLNRDNLPDLVISYTNGGTHSEFYSTPYLQFLINDGGGKFHDETAARLPQATVGTGGWYKFIDVVDLNGDGAADLVTHTEIVNGKERPGGSIFMNDGFGSFVELKMFAPFLSVHASDVNGDGRAEILTADQNGLRVITNDLPLVARTVGGTAGNDTLVAQIGNSLFSGGGGVDTVRYNASANNYTVFRQGDVFFVSDKATGKVTDTLIKVERIQFGDASLALDIDGNAGQTYRVYQAAFDRTPDIAGLSYWIKAMDNGYSLRDIAAGFVNSAEFKTLYGANPTNADIINKFYLNVLHRTPDQAGVDFWVGVLDRKADTIAGVLAGFSESAENQAALIGVIGNGIEFFP